MKSYFISKWGEKYSIVSLTVADQGTKISITDTKSYAPRVSLSTQNNTKLLQQLKLGFKRTINEN